MAFEIINPFNAIWKNLGLEFILLPEDKIKEFQKGAKPAVIQRKMPPEASASVHRTAPIPRKPPVKKEIHASSRTPEATQERSAAWTRIPKEQWPDIWKEQLTRTKKGVIAWTYWGLGLDLFASRDKTSQAQDAENRALRSNFLNSMLRDLGHPAGTHTFWPLCLPDNDNYEPNRNIFLSGLQELGCRGILVFGSMAAKEILQEDNIRPLQSKNLPGFFVWTLMDIDALVKLPTPRANALAYLRSTLKLFIPHS